jgi:hypothetical protein
MTERRPLVLVSGVIKELPSGDTLPGSAALWHQWIPASMFVPDTDALIAVGDLGAYLDKVATKTALKFPDGSDEYCGLSPYLLVPSTFTAGHSLQIRIHYFGDAAPSSNNRVDWEVAVEAVTASDAFDLQGTNSSFDSTTASYDEIDANAGELTVHEITLANGDADDLAANDLIRVALRRDSDDGTNDTYADTVWVLGIELVEVAV